MKRGGWSCLFLNNRNERTIPRRYQGNVKIPSFSSFPYSPWDTSEQRTAWISLGCQFLARSSSPSPMFLHHVCGTWNYSRAKGNVACATLEIPPFIKLNPSSLKSSHSPLISLFVQRKRGVREILSQILDYANRCWIAATTNAFLC